MKLSSALFLSFLTGLAPLAAQTNIFPSSGNVGIGTTSPSSKLEANGTVRVTGISTPTTNGGGLELSYNGSVGIIESFNRGSGGIPLYIYGYPTVMMGGNVGIGTTGPGAKLDIVAGSLKEIATYTPTAASGISDFSVGGVGWVFSRPEDGALTEAIYSYNSTGGAKNNLAISSRNDIAFTAGNSGPSAAPERMRITDSGNVGIGTANPSTRLEVNGDTTLKAAGHAYLFLSGSSGDSELLWQENGTNRWALGMNVGEGTQNFNLYNYTTGATNLSVNKATGNVGIGTTSPGSYKLAVNGTIHAKEVVVDLTGWSDYVFDESYQLSALSEVEHYIRERKHLPGIPSAAEVAQGGASLGDMQAKLLAKVEELTLHVIAQNKRLDDQAARIATLEQENLQLHTR